jgi:cytochrome c oxidase assembly factor CtaG
VRDVGRIVEVLATVAIVVAVGAGGRLMLTGLQRHGTAAAAVIALGVAAGVVVLRRDYRAGGEGVRLNVTRDSAYLTALALLFWAVVTPARWLEGSAIAMIEVALVFDAFTRLIARGI